MKAERGTRTCAFQSTLGSPVWWKDRHHSYLNMLPNDRPTKSWGTNCFFGRYVVIKLRSFVTAAHEQRSGVCVEHALKLVPHDVALGAFCWVRFKAMWNARRNASPCFLHAPVHCKVNTKFTPPLMPWASPYRSLHIIVKATGFFHGSFSRARWRTQMYQDDVWCLGQWQLELDCAMKAKGPI